MGMPSVSSNNIKMISNALLSEETDTVNLESYSFSYSEVQFVVVVNEKFEKIINSSTKNEIYFETESLKIVPDNENPKRNIIVKNKTKSKINYSIKMLPWFDPYFSELNNIKESFEIFSSTLMQKTFPAIEFVPSNSVATLTHNLSKNVGEMSIRIVDYSDQPMIKRPVFGKLVGGQFQCGDLLISQNQSNPTNAIDVKFSGTQKPGYCFFRLEGRSLVLELLDSQNKNFNYTNRNLVQGKIESVEHNMDLDVSSLPVHIKLEYLVDRKPIFVPGNKPRTASFSRIGSKVFLNIIPSDLLIGEGNLGISVSSDSPKDVLIFENNINSRDNNFDEIGFTIDVNASFVAVTVHLELAHLSN